MSARDLPTCARARRLPVARRSLRPTAMLGAGAAGLLLTGLVWSAVPVAQAAQAEVGMGTAGSFAVLAGSAVTNTGASVISGDLGVTPGTAVSGFPPGTVVAGTRHVDDAVAAQAQRDLTTAYNDAAGRSTTADVTGTDLGGRRLTSGVYAHTSGMQLTGTLTLDAEGDPGAVFIFKAGSSLVTGSGSAVALVNGASPCNVFWQVGSSATLGTGTDFVGTVMALTSATLATGADVRGRVLARNGAVTLDTNDVTAPRCTPPTSTPDPTTGPTTGPSGSPSPSGTPTSTPSDTTPGPGDGTPTSGTPTEGPPTDGTPSGPPTDGTPSGPVTEGPPTPGVPVGHPETGFAGPAQPDRRSPLALFGLALVAAAGAVAAGVRATRVRRRH